MIISEYQNKYRSDYGVPSYPTLQIATPSPEILHGAIPRGEGELQVIVSFPHLDIFNPKLSKIRMGDGIGAIFLDPPRSSAKVRSPNSVVGPASMESGLITARYLSFSFGGFCFC